MIRPALTLLAVVSAGLSLGLPSDAAGSFGFKSGTDGFEAVAQEDGAPYLTAGGHPYALRVHLGLETVEAEPGVVTPDGDLRNLRLQLPPGLLVNPEALLHCNSLDFNRPRVSPFEESASGESCPEETQVGTVTVHQPGGIRHFGLFNLEGAPGAAGQLGFAPYGVPVLISVKGRTQPDGQAILSLEMRNFPQSIPVNALDLDLWGDPWAASHNGERGNCLNAAEPGLPWAKCSVDVPELQKAYVTMPTDCSSELTVTATASSWQQSESTTMSFTPSDGGQRLAPQGCSEVNFEPTVAAQLSDERASSPSGFRFQLSAPAAGLVEPGGRVGSQVRRAVVTLPPGTTINPSLGSGLGVCSPEQFQAERPLANEGEGCPNASKIGAFTVDTPLSAESMRGAIYIATPYNNPFGSLLAIYLVARDSNGGFLITASGSLDPDPHSGTIAAHLNGLPQLPYAELEVNFRAGQRAPLVSPPTCGPAVTAVELVPYAEGAPVSRTSTVSNITAGAGGGPCPSGTPSFNPQIVAGSLNSNVGSYSTFYLRMSRSDVDQEITSYSAVLPKGITGRLAGIPFCPEAAIAAARDRSGQAEQADPSCPTVSEVGRVLSGYGVGSALTWSPGRLYLAGPYHGSPVSLVAINAANIGPFDLGTVVVRSAFDVDPLTAQLSIDSTGSDPIPHILDGIPLHLRDIRVFLDRSSFTRNPSSCQPSAITSTLTGAGARFDDSSDDSSATASNHFQLLNCRTLGFEPKLGIRLRGLPRRGAYPSLRATFASRGSQDSNLKTIEVTMPRSEFLAQEHIKEVCTMPQFAASRCPANSAYGRAVAHTPLFDEPLRGSVYLRSSRRRLPDLVADLRSGAMQIVVEGKIGPSKSGMRLVFENLPDAPLTRFVLTMYGGSRGLLVNSTDICVSKPRATVSALGQNDVGAKFTSRLRNRCAGEERRR
ncbi:MAG: hypothetical protein QOF06_532 [Solirubrobacterales bacterium]|jgi:hypothetical protein|nr:hypothetical protein [Solirubrobacterales bacterium]